MVREIKNLISIELAAEGAVWSKYYKNQLAGQIGESLIIGELGRRGACAV